MKTAIMNEFRKGNWVHYDGIPRNHTLGQVIQQRSSFGLVRVSFIDGKEYDCYPQFLTKLSKDEAATELAKLAMKP